MNAFTDIIEAYRSYDSIRRKTPEQTEFRIYWASNCLRLYHATITKDIESLPAYAFIVKYPRYREVFGTCAAACVIHHYIYQRLAPILEKELSAHTYNNRKEMGQMACQNAVITDIAEVSRNFTQDAWVIKVDLKACFPNLSQDVAYEGFRKLIEKYYFGEDKDELLYYLAISIFSYPAEHCQKLSPIYEWSEHIDNHKSLFKKLFGVGGAIGYLIWQMIVAYYFHQVDEFFEHSDIHFERYVDDIYIISSSKDVLLLLPKVREILAKVGATLHPHKFYCQHYTKGVECLGVHIKMNRIHPNRRVIRKAILRVKEFNKNINPYMAEKVVASLNSYFGICKATSGYKQAMEILMALNSKWFSYMTWNDRRMCLNVKKEYSKNYLLIKQYNLYEKRTITTPSRKAA